MKYIECGVCGAIRVEAEELARVVHSFITPVEDDNDKFSYLCSDILEKIIVFAPDDLEGYVNFLQWKKANERSAYLFLDPDGKTCGCYDELVIYHDLSCDCFGKDKIKDEITTVRNRII